MTLLNFFILKPFFLPTLYMQYATLNAYSNNIYTYVASVDRGQTTLSLYRRGVSGRFGTKKGEGFRPPG